MTLAIGTRIGAYEVRPLEGRGGTADVYRAVDTRIGREVALKVLSRETRAAGKLRALARLEHEARVLATLDHPNIARLHGIETVDGVHALVLELVEGPTLADRIAAGPIAVPEALTIGRQIAAALEAAHERGIVHRDLKPSNIKFAAGGTVKLIDFGLARVLQSSSAPDGRLPPTITSHGIAVGTAAYMSPEQARGDRVDARTDIWAFGCVVYEMLTGARAYPGDDTASTLAAVLCSEPDWSRLPDALPGTARAFIRRCLSKSLADRLRHIGDVTLALDGAFEPESSQPLESAGARPARPSSPLGVGRHCPGCGDRALDGSVAFAHGRPREGVRDPRTTGRAFR